MNKQDLRGAVAQVIGEKQIGLCQCLRHALHGELREAAAFNGQPGRQQLFLDLMRAIRFDEIVETGTFRGDTAAFMARRSRRPVFSSESSPRHYGYSRARFAFHRKVHVTLADSRAFLRAHFGKRDRAGTVTFVYLDAHWGPDLPLFEETRILFALTSSIVVMIDDFQVPDDPGYAFDSHGIAAALNLDYLRLREIPEVRVFFPALRSFSEAGSSARLRRPCAGRTHGRCACGHVFPANVGRAVTRPDQSIIRLRGDYRRLNESFDRSFAFRFGRGGGLCAEMLGVVKTMMSCLNDRTRLCMSQGGRPAGVGIVDGFTDYFEPVFPVVDAGLWNALNIATVRGSGRFPVVRRGISRLLHAATGADYFMMDDLGALPARLVVPELGIDAEYWDACALLVGLVWNYRPEVKEEVMRVLSDWGVPDSYLSVHVRRGDKNVESPYVPLDRYVTAIDRARPEGCAVVVASDDATAASELARLLPSRFPIVACSAANSRGYVQGEFNRLPAADRFRQVKRFLAELELLRGGGLFVGSAGSNVTYLIEMMRAGQGVLRVE